MVLVVKHKHGRYFVLEPRISSQYIGYGKTKKDALKDYNSSLKLIFSNPKDRAIYSIKKRRR